ncbi:hypothetical protein BGZ60DRAFT_410231 [Tricladium varicosporioides]|nr:hypothetical protein BGZ60DRAFT_410231 [Hymenoscyphus varicosporioides]
MTRSELQRAGISYITIIAISMVVFHEAGRNAYDHVWEDPVLKNFTTALNRMPINKTAADNSTLITLLHISDNATVGTVYKENAEHFYRSYFPRNLFVYGLLFPLSYYWQIYLERFFPARPRSIETNEKVEFNVNEGQEEEVVKRWIAQGKIKRASVSWWNTFVKWVLDLTVGRLWFYSLGYLMDKFIMWKTVEVILGRFKSAVLLQLFSSFLSITPFTSLIGFVIIPATKRVVFRAAVNTVEGVFVEYFYRVAIPWVVHTDFAQKAMINATEVLVETYPRGGINGTHLLDEL